MTSEAFYDIHGLLRVQVEATPAVIRETDVHLRAFRVAHLTEPADVTIRPYSRAPKGSRATVVDDHEYGDGVYHRSETRMLVERSGAVHSYYMDRLLTPVNLIVQLALIDRDLTFVHAAAVSIDGQGLLLPAYPGTGKTTITTSLVRGGAQFLSDDLCILGHGKLYSYPQDLSVYSHHLPILGYSTPQMRMAFARTRLIDAIGRTVATSQRKVAKATRLILAAIRCPSIDVPVENVFGSAAIGTAVPHRHTVALERSGDVLAPEIERPSADELGAQAATILWHEWHAYFHDLLLYDALAEGGQGLVKRVQKCARLIALATSKSSHVRVRIPAAWDNEKLIAEVPCLWKRLSIGTQQDSVVHAS